MIKDAVKMSRFLQATCLKPHYSLRYQLFVSYGMTSAIAIGVVILIATLTVKSSGDCVKREVRDLLKGQVIANTRVSAEHAAVTLSKKFENLEGVVLLMAEFASDRIVGYPNNEWAEDRFVPFYDTLSGRNVYPLLSDPLPPDWNITVNVNDTNFQEHVQNRWQWYTTPISTKSAVYRMQGQCDPFETDPTSLTYYENCTEANNDLLTGGIVEPTETNRYLAEKAADLAIFLKPLYEAYTDVTTVGIYFANSGAGSSLVYPGRIIDGQASYKSIGCDWMREINTNDKTTGLPYGTEEEIKRCHPIRTWVPAREYNPLERQWCRDQALNPDKVQIVGPYVDAFRPDLWLLTIGKALMDRMTGHFVGCTLLDVSIGQIADIIGSVKTNMSSDIAMVRWEDGTVVYSTAWDTTDALETINCSDLDICDDQTFHHLQSLVDFNAPWKYEEVMAKFRNHTYANAEKLLAAFPIPLPPPVYDPQYRPQFMVIQSVGENIFSLIDEVESSIDEDVSRLFIATVLIGFAGIVLVLIVSWTVAIFLTRPLKWMMDVAKSILHHSSDKTDDYIYDRNKKPLLKWTPKTEITDLVSEFESIIEGFSGDGPASVASPNVHEVLNKVSWEEAFGKEYLEHLFDKQDEAEDVAETRTSLTSSVASYASKCEEPDETSLDEIDKDNGTSAVSKIEEPQSEMKQMEEQLALMSVTGSVRNLSAKAWEADNCALEGKEDAVTVPHSEIKVIDLPKEHMMSCSSSTRVHTGPVAYGVEEDEHFQDELRTTLNHNQILHSPLFWWIVMLIVAPVLITMAAICVIVPIKVTPVLPSWLGKVEQVSINLEIEATNSACNSHAAIAKEIFVDPVTDLHLLTRVSGWLIFGGLKQADSFTGMSQSTEECKTFPADMSCGFFSDDDRAPCDCSWEDPHAMSCREYDDERSLQKQFYAGQAQDADPITGSRTSTSFPIVDYSPSTTLWWNETTSMPGGSNLTFDQGYATVYDRTRVMSAMATATVPLYNYRSGRRRRHLGMFIGFEADGMLAGYDGCDYSYAQFSHFQSSLENGASVISPKLCPPGKYGYDARCRGWYNEGKLAGSLHLTTPYEFAGTRNIAISVTFSLVDASSGVHIGQSLIDFFPEGLREVADHHSLDHRLSSFNILITPNSDALGGDTLAGPGYAMGSKSPPIQKLVMPCDSQSSQNRRHFDMAVLAHMKGGKKGTRTFQRRVFVTNGDNVTCGAADEEESMFISYAPVVIRSSKPLRSDDFARGINVSEILMGSWGTVVPSEDLTAPFAFIEDQASDEISDSTALFIPLIAATATITTVILVIITISVVKPVTILLEFVKLINKKHTLYDIPPMRGGSREVNQVYASLAKLHKIVRFSNMAFFSGKMRAAYNFLTDALSLFRSADDQKAIGIAANNLGNTCMAIRNQKISTSRCFRIDGKCVQNQALQSYDEAIASATNEYNVTSSTENADLKAKLAEQLANRYFNRGLFFLLTANDKCAAEESSERGRQDLLKSRALDAEVRDIWVETRQIHKNSAQYFERLLRRANGLIGLMQENITEGGSWNVAELLDEADSLLFVVWNIPGSPLFKTLSSTGRLQQLEGTAIRYELCRGNTKKAARISYRILSEDEYITESTFSAAASAMLTWFREEPPPQHLRAFELAIRRDFRCMLRSCKTSSDAELGKNLVIFQDLACHDECDYILQGFYEKLFDSCHDDDLIMIMSSSLGTEMRLRLQRKGDMKLTDWSPGWNRRRVRDINTDFRRAIRIVLESEEAFENDTWVIVTTDRGRWNPVECRLSESHHYLLSEIVQLNKARNSIIHVAIVGMDADDNTAEICRELCRVSRESKFVNVKDGPDDLDDALADIASLVIGGGKSTFPDGITMEALN